MRRLNLLVAAALVAAVAGADWPQWRGPNRDGVSAETGLLKTWPKDGPRLVWTFDKAGLGYSAPAVVGDRVYVLGCRDDLELVLALDAGSGKELWSAKIAPAYNFKGNSWGEGPRCTPTVDAGHVYAQGSQGELVCVAAADGKEVWRKNLPKDLAGEVNPVGGGPPKMGWGYSACPLVDGDKLVCVPGGPKGLLAALNKKTGELIWQSAEAAEQATYSSPVVTEVGGVRQYVQVTQDGMVGIAAKDGKLLWRYQREAAYPDVVIPTPAVRGDLAYTSVGYGGASTLVKLTAEGGAVKAEVVYSNNRLANRLGGVVLVGDHVYGFHETNRWVCQELKSGKPAWSSDRRALPSGSVAAADGHLYVVCENGLVGLVEASPAKYVEKGRFKLPKESAVRRPNGKVWTHPVVANGRLYVRDQELLFSFDVRGTATSQR
jgi:outer membrane protein assembly factor BamB